MTARKLRSKVSATMVAVCLAAVGCTGSEVEDTSLDPLTTPSQDEYQEVCGLDAGDKPTPSADLDPDRFVLLLGADGFAVCLGPAALDGPSLESAEPAFDGNGWTVDLVFREGAMGIDGFNQIAFECSNSNPDICPTKELAFVTGNVVIAAPAIQASEFSRSSVVISLQQTESEVKTIVGLIEGVDGTVQFRPVWPRPG